MHKCQYQLQIGSQLLVFDSIDELDNYIILHYDQIILLNKGLDLKLSNRPEDRTANLAIIKLANIQQRVVEIGKAENDYNSDFQEFVEKPSLIAKAKGYQGVTSYGVKREVNLNHEKVHILQEFNLDNYKKKLLDAAIMKHANINPKRGATWTEAEKDAMSELRKLYYADDILKLKIDSAIAIKVEQMKRDNKHGRLMHSAYEAAFQYLITNGYPAFQKLNMDQMKNMLDASLLKDISETEIGYLSGLILNNIKDVARRLNLENLAHIFSEFTIPYENNDTGLKLIGILDLVVVDKKGKVFLYDFKSSSKSNEAWSQAKKHATVLQLGYYQAMLKSRGINTQDVAYIPIVLQHEDVNDDNIVTSIISSIPISLKSDLSSSGADMYRNIRKLIAEDIPHILESDHLSDDASIEQIENFVKKTIGISLEDKVSKKDLDAEFNYIWNKKEKVKGDRVFFNKITEENEVLFLDKTKLKQRYLDVRTEWLSKNLGAQIIHTIINEYDNYKKDRENPELTFMERENLPFKISKTSHNRNDKYLKLLGKYKGDDWKRLENFGATKLGFVLFVNDLTKTIDVVSISDDELNTTKELGVGTTILGKEFSDYKFDKNEKILKSTLGNIELMKIMAFINFNPTFFSSEDYKIGELKAISLSTGGVFGDYETLKHNFIQLTEQYKLADINNLSDNSIQAQDTLYVLQTTINDIHKTYDKFGFENQSSLESFRTSLNTTIMGEEDTNVIKSKVLTLLKDELTRRLASKSMSNLSNATETDQVTKLISDLILHYENYLPLFERTLEPYTLKFQTISNIPSKFVNMIRSILDKATEGIKTRFLNYREGSVQLTENLFKDAGFTKLERYTLGQHPALFLNLFEREDGKISSEFILKNPNDLNNDLTPAQRAYVRHMLKTIFEFKNVGSDFTDLLLDSKINRAVPLIPATSLTHLKSGDYKQAIKYMLEKVSNPDSYLFNEDAKNDTNYNQFLSIDSYLLSEQPEDRQERLNTHKINDFETDLELIMDIFVLSLLRKSEFNEALPIVLAVRTSTLMSNMGVLNNIEPINDYVNNHLKITVSGDKIMSKGERKADRWLAFLRQISAVFNLMLNPISLTRESIQLFYGAASRALVHRYGSTQHKLKHLLKLFSIVIGETTLNVWEDMNKVESLNIYFGLSNMSLAQIPDRLSVTKTGIAYFFSKQLSGFNRAPEYMTRVGIFIAQLLKDDAWKAYSFDNDKLSYDCFKDGRFSIYLNDQTTHPQYEQSKALYMQAVQLFNIEDPELLLDWKKKDKLPAAYTNKEAESLKSYSDSILGYYDPSKKIQWQATLLGVNFMHFKTWLVAFRDKWHLTRQKSTVLGEYVPLLTDRGEQVYMKNGEYTMENTGEKLIVWEGKWNEGMLQSIGRVIYAAKKGFWEDAKSIVTNDKLFQLNMKMLLADLLALLIMFFTTKAIFGDTKRKDDTSYMTALLRAAVSLPLDLDPTKQVKTILSPGWLSPSFNYMLQLGTGLYDVAFEDKSFGKYVMSSFGITRPLQYFVNESTSSSNALLGGGSFGGGGASVKW